MNIICSICNEDSVEHGDLCWRCHMDQVCDPFSPPIEWDTVDGMTAVAPCEEYCLACCGPCKEQATPF